MNAYREIKISDQISKQQMFRSVSSNAIGSFGYGMFEYGVSFMLLRDTHSPLSFGMTLVVGPIMSLLFFIPIGNYVDANDHKKIIFWNYLMRLVIFALLGMSLPYFKGASLLIPVAIFESLDAILSDIRGATFSASAKQLVNESYIAKMASLTTTFASAVRILSPVLGVTFYSILSIESLIVIEFLITIVSLLLMMSLKFYNVDQSDEDDQNNQSQFQQFKETLQYMKKRPFVRDTIIAEIVVNFFYTAVVTGSSFIIVSELHLSNQVVSIVETGFAVGYLLGSMLTGLFKNQNYFTFKALGSLCSMGIVMIGMGINFAFTPTALLISIFGFVLALMIDFAFAIFDLSVEIRMQSTIETGILGRGSSTLYSTSFAIMPIGVLLFTGLFSWFKNGSIIFVISGLLLAIYALIIYKVFSNDIKKDDEYLKLTKNIKKQD